MKIVTMDSAMMENVFAYLVIIIGLTVLFWAVSKFLQ